MKGQGNILKTLLIAAAVYTLPLGAPVKRDTSDNTVIETCAAARNMMSNLPMCTNTTTTNCANSTFPRQYNAEYAAELLNRTVSDGFNAAVIGALQNCFNDSASSSQCELAAAAIRLHYALKNFINESASTDSPKTQIHLDCNSTAQNVEQTLCCASFYTLDVLDDVNNGKYNNNCI